MTETNSTGKKPFPTGWMIIVLIFFGLLAAVYASADDKTSGILYVVLGLGLVVLAVFASVEQSRVPIMIGGAVLIGLFISWIIGKHQYDVYQANKPTPTLVNCYGVQPLVILPGQSFKTPKDAITFVVTKENGMKLADEWKPGEEYWPNVKTFVYVFEAVCRGHIDNVLIQGIRNEGGVVLSSSPTQTPTPIVASTATQEPVLTPVP